MVENVTMVPSEVAAVFAAERACLAESPTPRTLAIGTKFPDGDLIDAVGRSTSLANVLAGSAGVVIFYRGAWCPYCNTALHDYQVHLLAPLTELGVTLVAISPQASDGSLTMKQKHSLEFPILSDPGNQIATALGILTHPSTSYLEAQRDLGLDITTVNADGTTALPMPTAALIDSAGRLAWMDVHPDYGTRTQSQQILDAVHELLRR